MNALRVVLITYIVSLVISHGAMAQNLVVYDDSLHYPWIKASWKVAAQYHMHYRANESYYSIRVYAQPWGGLGFHYGEWYSQGINPGSYTGLNFAVSSYRATTSLRVFFENDQGQPFPVKDIVAVGAWTLISLPMSEMNPNYQTINRFVIQNPSDKVAIFFVDNIQFTSAPHAGSSSTTRTSIAGETNQEPSEFSLKQNYPNPFNPSTTIRYELPEASHVRLQVFDVLGREVALLADERQPAGRYAVEFFADALPSGEYFYRVDAGRFTTVRKMMLIK